MNFLHKQKISAKNQKLLKMDMIELKTTITENKVTDWTQVERGEHKVETVTEPKSVELTQHNGKETENKKRPVSGIWLTMAKELTF